MRRTLEALACIAASPIFAALFVERFLKLGIAFISMQKFTRCWRRYAGSTYTEVQVLSPYAQMECDGTATVALTSLG